MRFEDAPGLFGCGIGVGTTQEVTCGICKTTYPDTGENGDTVTWTEFAGLEVAECCFEKIEVEIWRLRDDVLPWIRRILEKRKASNDANMKELDAIAKLRKKASPSKNQRNII